MSSVVGRQVDRNEGTDPSMTIRHEQQEPIQAAKTAVRWMRGMIAVDRRDRRNVAISRLGGGALVRGSIKHAGHGIHGQGAYSRCCYSVGSDCRLPDEPNTITVCFSLYSGAAFTWSRVRARV